MWRVGPFDDARLARLYRGIARSQPPPAPGSARPRRLPITGPILAGLVRHARLLKQPAKARAMAAALAMGFFGLLRAGEFRRALLGSRRMNPVMRALLYSYFLYADTTRPAKLTLRNGQLVLN